MSITKQLAGAEDCIKIVFPGETSRPRFRTLRDWQAKGFLAFHNRYQACRNPSVAAPRWKSRMHLWTYPRPREGRASSDHAWISTPRREILERQSFPPVAESGLPAMFLACGWPLASEWMDEAKGGRSAPPCLPPVPP